MKKRLTSSTVTFEGRLIKSGNRLRNSGFSHRYCKNVPERPTTLCSVGVAGRITIREFLLDHLAATRSWARVARNSERFPRLAVYSGDSIGHEVQQHGFYELEQLLLIVHLIGDHLRQKIVVDVGANIGNHTRFLGPYCESVIALEPNPAVFKLLQVNAPANATCLQIAASELSGEATLKVPGLNLGGASLSLGQLTSDEGDQFQCRLEKLDEILADVDPKDIALIKIDVEGHELSVLEGSRGILERSNAVLMMESLAGNHQPEVEILLRQAGYSEFVDISCDRVWRWKHRLKLTKAIEGVLLGVPDIEARAIRLRGLTAVHHSALLVSKWPLIKA